jgi:hypothetical protein
MKIRLVIIALAISFYLPGFCFAYGGGEGGESGSSDEIEMLHEHAGGGVTWTENPNGADVIGSSVWNGRPAEIERGPYQRGTAVEDAEQALLDGLKTGLYTEEEVKANLEWAVRVNIGISNEAKDILNNKPSTSASQAPASQGASSGSSGTPSTSGSQAQPGQGASSGSSGTPNTSKPQNPQSTGTGASGGTTSASTAASTTSTPTTPGSPPPASPDQIRLLAKYIWVGMFDQYIKKFMRDHPNMDAKRLAGKITRDLCKKIKAPINKLYRPLLASDIFHRIEVIKED